MQFVPCMSLRPGWTMERSVSPAGLWRGLEGCPLFGSRPHLHRSSFPSLIEPTIFSSRIWRGRLVVTAHRISTGTRGQKPWCLGCSSNDGRPRRPRRHQICPHRHLIFSPPLPLAQHPWDCGFFRVASLADWSARKVFFHGGVTSSTACALPASGRSKLHVRIFPYRFSSR